MATDNGNQSSNTVNVQASLADFKTAEVDRFAATKVDKINRVAALVRRWVGAIWGNGVDDFILRVIELFPRIMHDTLAAPQTTATAANGGGTVDFTLDMNGAESGTLKFLRIVSVGGLTAVITVQLFADAARTVEVYNAAGVDPSTQYVERTPAFLLGDAVVTLEAGTVYGRITNNGAAGSTFTVQAVCEGV